jgi:glycosyltransferase involved in cell wall biosynthesis
MSGRPVVDGPAAQESRPPGRSGISVIIPTYNDNECLPHSVSSVLSQTRAACDLIVVDDGSTEDPESVLSPFAGQVTLIRQENQGCAGARNTGAEQAAGSAFLFLDVDDELTPNAIETLEADALRTGAGVVFGTVLKRGPDLDTPELLVGDRRGCAGAPPHPAFRNFWKSSIQTCGTAIIRRDVFEDVGGFVADLRYGEDRNIWIRLGVITAFHWCDEITLIRHRRHGSVSRQYADMILGSVHAQFHALEWCDQRGIDTSFLGIEHQDLIDRAFNRAREQYCPEAAERIIALAHERSLVGSTVRHATRMMWWSRLRSWLRGGPCQA